jgi:hypothetical protein
MTGPNDIRFESFLGLIEVQDVSFPTQQVSAYLEIHTKRYGCFNFSRWIIPKIQKFVHLSYFCCPIPSLPKLGSSSSQKPAQQHFSSP